MKPGLFYNEHESTCFYRIFSHLLDPWYSSSSDSSGGGGCRRKHRSHLVVLLGLIGGFRRILDWNFDAVRWATSIRLGRTRPSSSQVRAWKRFCGYWAPFARVSIGVQPRPSHLFIITLLFSWILTCLFADVMHNICKWSICIICRCFMRFE